MSNFISIKWDRFLAEGEAQHFPWLKKIQAADSLEDIWDILESDIFRKVGSGSFRRVFEPASDPGYVIKVINENDPYKRRMNEDDFDTAKRYPFIFPKAFAHADDFSWIVMEKTPPLIYPEDMQKVLDQSFPAEQKALLNTTNLPGKDAIFGDQWNLADPFDIMKMIMASFRYKRARPPKEATPSKKETALAYLVGSGTPSTENDIATNLQYILAPVAGPAYQELSKAMHEFPIDKYEIGRGNIGHDKDYNFKIVDSSVFDDDYNPEELLKLEPEPEYFVDTEKVDDEWVGRWTKTKPADYPGDPE